MSKYKCQWKQNISVGHYEKIEKWLPFHKYRSYRKISNYWPPKIWVSSFPSVNGNGISVLAIMKKLKNGYHFVNIDHMEKVQINDPPPPPKFGSPFSVCQWKQNISIIHYEKIEKWPPFCKYQSYRKISTYWPPQKFGSLVFCVSTEMEYQCQPLWKNWKMATIS